MSPTHALSITAPTPPSSAEPESVWLTTRAAANVIGVTPEFIYDACAARGLRHTRLGGKRHIRIHRDWLREWMEAHSAVPTTGRTPSQVADPAHS